MKKVILAALVMGLLLGGISLGAQEKKVAMSLNLGAMTYVGSEGDSFSDFLFSLGAQVDWRLGSSFMLSPEVQVLTYRFHFDYVLVDPGLVLNYTSKSFFAGAGLIFPILVGEGETWTGKLSPKLNIGYSGRHLVLAGYLITNAENLFKENLVGFTLGYKF
ncbi:MAG: hypothetical protein QHH43_02560 [Candidatus Saccharicenans sp.]|jgi:hypothetical protein|nr:hypothetical protein [Candidatus Saccharicenans sp.]MDH7574627.1 hypothetical protein [Candidatus Saccharicenans sp.]